MNGLIGSSLFSLIQFLKINFTFYKHLMLMVIFYTILIFIRIDFHDNIHHVNKCAVCNVVFKTHKMLDIHNIETHDVFFKFSKNPNYQCLDLKCNESFKTKDERFAHVNSLHSKTFLRVNLNNFNQNDDETFCRKQKTDNVFFGNNNIEQLIEVDNRPKKIAVRKFLKKKD